MFIKEIETEDMKQRYTRFQEEIKKPQILEEIYNERKKKKKERETKVYRK